MADSKPERIVCYFRDRGVLCYEVDLLGPAGMRSDEFVAGLVGSDMDWWWHDEIRSHDLRRERGTLRFRRLTSDSAEVLSRDLSFRDEDGYGKLVLMVGCRSDLRSTNPSAIGWSEELKSFTLDRANRIETVIVQLGDSLREYLYVRRQPADYFALLLERWGVRDGGRFEKRDYRKLRSAMLEHLLGM